MSLSSGPNPNPSTHTEPSPMSLTLSKNPSAANSIIPNYSNTSSKSFDLPYSPLNIKSASFMVNNQTSLPPVKTPPATNAYDTFTNSTNFYQSVENAGANTNANVNISTVNNINTKATWEFKPINGDNNPAKAVGYNCALPGQSSSESLFGQDTITSPGKNENATQTTIPFATKNSFSPFSNKVFDYHYLPTVTDSSPSTRGANTSSNTAPNTSLDLNYFTSPFSITSKADLPVDTRSLQSSSSNEFQEIAKYGINGTHQDLVFELNKKDRLIENLREHNLKCATETTHLKKLLSECSSNNISTIHYVDPAIETMLRKLSNFTQEQDRDIVHLRNQLQTALTILNTDTNEDDTIVNRLVARLEALTEENTQLGKMLSFGRAQQKNVEIGMLKFENNLLKSRIKDYQAVCTELNKNLEDLTCKNTTNGNRK